MEVASLNIDQIKLDYTNPRIARILEMYPPDKITAEQVALALGAAGGEDEGENYTSFRSLRESIRCNGGVIHPIIVNRKDKEYVVIEGNTRVQVYREFIKKGIEGDWSTIPAVVHDNLSQSGIDAIRLQAHLVGPRPWQAYSKAKYLNHLRNSEHMTFEQIVEFCGGKRKEVDRYISAYNDMEEYYRPALREGEVFDPQRFSAFVELQRPDRQAALVHNGFDKTDFSRWIIDERLYPLVRVRDLPRILNHDRAREVFLQDGAEEALKILDYTEEEMDLSDADLIDLAKALSQKISQLPFSRIKELKGDARANERIILANARDLLSDLLEQVDENDDG